MSFASVSPRRKKLSAVSQLQEKSNQISFFIVYFKLLRLTLIVDVMIMAYIHICTYIYTHLHMKCNFFSVLKYEN